MSTIGIFSLLFISCFVICNGLTPTSYLTKVDKEKLKSIFDISYKKGHDDLKTVSLVVFGYSLLEETFGDKKEACDMFRSVCETSDNLVDLYHCSLGASYLGQGECLIDVAKMKSRLTNVGKVETIEALYQIVMSTHFLGLKNEPSVVNEAIDRVMKKESGAVSQAYSYLIAAKIYTEKKDMKKYWVDIEDTMQQADEADGTLVYFEGGIFNTAHIVVSVFELSERYGQAPPIAADKLAKLANFLMSRKQSHSLSAAVQLTLALKSLSRNNYAVPLVILPVSDSVLDKISPQLKLSVSNLWGDPISNAQVVAETVKNVHTAVTVITRQHATQSTLPGQYELDLSSGKMDKGFYSVKLEIKVNETRFSDITSSSFVVKVTSDVTIEQAEISVKERDQATGAQVYKLAMDTLLSDKLNINWHHRLEMKFSIKDGQQIFKPHQVFIKMTHTKTSQEIIFVAEADKTDIYKFTLDLEKSNKDFDNLSGYYDMQLIVGDVLIKKPLQWTFANIKMEMPGSPSTDSSGESRRSVAGMKKTISVNPRIGLGPSVAKEQIFHVFRPAEKRAGDLIANVFTVLCTVPPLMVMLVLWTLVGVNVSNFDVSVSSTVFHGGLAVIFGLYYCYWSYLDMFTTLRCLIPLGAVTAFFGNRVLRKVAARRTKA